MKILCVIFSLLLAAANLANSYFGHGVNTFVILWSVAMTVCYLRILYTRSAENEVYETWKKLLPKDDAEIKHNIKISTLVLFVSYVVYILLQRWKWFAGLDSVPGFGAMFILAIPMMSVSLGYGAGKTIKKAKSYFDEVVEILVKTQGFEHLKERREQLTPDTPFFVEIVKTTHDAFFFTSVISKLIERYDIPYSDDKDELEMWNNFCIAHNRGETKPEFIKSGMECGRLFGIKHKTLGGIAIWIAESKRYQSMKQFADKSNI